MDRCEQRCATGIGDVRRLATEALVGTGAPAVEPLVGCCEIGDERACWAGG